MREYYSINNKIIIRCIQCKNKLRVPIDKGKISVQCPVCNKKFIYNPNSISHTLRQILLSIGPSLPKTRKNQAILLAVVIGILIILFFLLSGQSSRRNMNLKPGNLSYHIRQERFIDKI